MASTGTARRPAANDDSAVFSQTEGEPLLGRPGDALQQPDEPMIRNLYLGTGWLALVGSILLLAVVWSGVFTHPTLPLVSPHPLLQSLGVVTLILAILVLQPTGSTAQSKILGQRAHAVLMVLALAQLVAGVAVIETNKAVNHMAHLHSLHGILGVLAGTLFLAQYVFGVCMWAVPNVLGGEEKAKGLWKYHRYSGYALLLLLLVTLISAAETDYVKKVLEIKTWAVVLSVLLVALGVYPRIQLRKLGIQRN